MSPRVSKRATPWQPLSPTHRGLTSARHFHNAKIAGYTNSSRMNDVNIPPIIGAAIRFITSAPEMDRAFSPHEFGGDIPGAVPQAGIEARRWRWRFLPPRCRRGGMGICTWGFLGPKARLIPAWGIAPGTRPTNLFPPPTARVMVSRGGSVAGSWRWRVGPKARPIPAWGTAPGFWVPHTPEG